MAGGPGRGRVGALGRFLLSVGLISFGAAAPGLCEGDEPEAEDGAEIAWGLESTVEALEDDRREHGGGELTPSAELNLRAREWAEAVADGKAPPPLSEVLERLAAGEIPHRRLAVASLRSTLPEPPSPEAWRGSGASWQNLLTPELRTIGSARVATHDGGRVWVLMAGEAQADAIQPALERLEDRDRVRAEVLDLVNSARRTHGGLKALTPNEFLDRAAQKYAELMASTGHYGHVGPEGRALDFRLAREGYRYRSAGENLARGVETPEDVVRGWLDSPEHRENLLDRRFRETGLGVAWGPAEEGIRIVWVQVFARSR